MPMHILGSFHGRSPFENLLNNIWRCSKLNHYIALFSIIFCKNWLLRLIQDLIDMSEIFVDVATFPHQYSLSVSGDVVVAAVERLDHLEGHLA